MKKLPKYVEVIIDKGVLGIKPDPKDPKPNRIVRAKKAYIASKAKGSTGDYPLRDAMLAAANGNVHLYADAMSIVNRLLFRRDLTIVSRNMKKNRLKSV